MRDDDAVFRHPWWLRVPAVVIAAAWLTMAGGTLVVALWRHSSPVVVLPVLAMTVSGVIVYRMYRMGVYIDDDVLTVRNQFRTRVLHRDEIEEFRVGNSRIGMPGGRIVYVLLADGDLLSLDITATLTPLSGSRRRLQERLERLRTWHAGARRSHGLRPRPRTRDTPPRPDATGGRTRRVSGLWRS